MENVTTLSSEGQITIPKAIRDELGLRPHDKLRFVIDGRAIHVEKAYPSLEEIAGSLPAPHVRMDIDEAIALAWEEVAAEEYRKIHEE